MNVGEMWGDVREQYDQCDVVRSVSSSPDVFVYHAHEALPPWRPATKYDHVGMGTVLSVHRPVGVIAAGDVDAAVGWWLDTSHPVIEKRLFLIENMVGTTLCENELARHDTVLRVSVREWWD